MSLQLGGRFWRAQLVGVPAGEALSVCSCAGPVGTPTQKIFGRVCSRNGPAEICANPARAREQSEQMGPPLARVAAEPQSAASEKVANLGLCFPPTRPPDKTIDTAAKVS